MTVRFLPPGAAAGALVLLAFSLFLPSAAQGTNQFTQNGTQPTVTHPILPASNCRDCHGEYDNANSLEPWDTWAGSMMAQSARDPLFWAALDVANHDLPGIGDWCLRCHAPGAWLAGRSLNGGAADGCNFLGVVDSTASAAGPDFDGVTCHACHRMMVNPSPPDGQQPFYLGNGDFWIDDGTCNGQGEPCRRGPYNYAAGGTAPDDHAWAYSEYHTKSDICGNCHNVTSPALNLIDQDGTDTELKYPIERTYQEWKKSDFSTEGGADFKTCQNCHMVDATVDPAYACINETNNHTGNLPMHQLAGGNAWIPQVLKAIYPDLNLAASFDATRNLALEMLQQKSATIDVDAADEVVDGKIAVEVKVTNLTGHKLPTGYGEGRRMWLRVTAHDNDGNVLFESGKWDSTTGVLTMDPAITVYEVKQGIWDDDLEVCVVEENNKPHFHFVKNNCIRKDNRIPPKGFTGKDDKETQPIPLGYYPETSPGSGKLVNYDVRTYQVPFPDGTEGPMTVTAELLYQTASKEYVDFLRDEAIAHTFPNDCLPRNGVAIGKSRGAYLHQLWTDHGKSAPVVMVSATDISDLTGTHPVDAPLPGAPTELRLAALSAPNESVQRIAYDLPAPTAVRLTVFNVAGRAVRTLVNRYEAAGAHQATWNTAREADGVYFLRLEAGSAVVVRRVVVVR